MLEVLEQACSFDIWKFCSDFLVSEILKKSDPSFRLYILIRRVYEMWKKVIDYCEN